MTGPPRRPRPSDRPGDGVVRPPPSLAERRERLLVRSAELRQRIAQDGGALAPPLALADGLREGWRWLRTHPEWPAGAALALLLLKPRRALRWASRGWWAWRLWQRARRALDAALR